MLAKSGHTFIELIITLCCITILIGISVPFDRFLQKYKLNTATDNLYHNLLYKRQLALATNTQQTIYLEKFNLEKGVSFG